MYMVIQDCFFLRDRASRQLGPLLVPQEAHRELHHLTNYSLSHEVFYSTISVLCKACVRVIVKQTY